MNYSKNWLQKYIEDKLPADDVLVDKLSLFAFEVESADQKLVGQNTDTIFDIKVLPNRAHDCLSHRGMAKEIAYILGLKLSKEAESVAPLGDEIVRDDVKLSVVIDDLDACPRWAGVRISGVKIGPSPSWLVDLLGSIGQRSINNVVDATNYVLYALGRPCHAFDASKLSSPKISVRYAKEDEEITLLTGETKKLSNDVLCIADGGNNELLGIAGVKGGIRAEVDENTTDIIVEMANFDAGTIRRSARRYQILTDASKRFEAGMSSEAIPEALAMCTGLVLELAGGQVVAKTDSYSRPEATAKVGLSIDRCNAVLGTKLSAKQIEDIFSRRGWDFKEIIPLEEVAKNLENYLDKPYVYGATLAKDAPDSFDCSSFVAYLYAEAGLPVPFYIPADQFSIDQYVATQRLSENELEIGDLIFSNTHTGTIRIKSEMFMSGTEVLAGVDHVGLYAGDGYVVHATKQYGKVVKEKLSEAERFKDIVGYGRVPHAKEKRYLISIPSERLDLRIEEDMIEEVVQSLGYNSIDEKVQDISTNKIEYPKVNVIKNILINLGFSEIYTYAFNSNGDVELANPLASDKAFMRKSLLDGMKYSLDKGVQYSDELCRPVAAYFEIGAIFDKAGEYFALSVGARDNTKKQNIAKDLLDQAVGELSKIGLEVNYDKSKNQESFEIVLNDSWRGTQVDAPSLEKDQITQYTPFSVYPAIVRDIAMFANSSGLEEKIAQKISDNSGELVKSIRLFDVFTKEGESRTSYAFRLVLQADDKTLTDVDANNAIEPIVESLKSEGYEIR